MVEQPKLIDVQHSIHEDYNGLVLERRQEIPQEFLSQLRGMRADSNEVREKEFMLAASVPVAVHELWLSRDNYDMTKEDIRTTLKKLHAEGLDTFITTNKRV
jgi:hypothetical protein